jgi:putative hydrolase of the HAD superfamily
VGGAGRASRHAVIRAVFFDLDGTLYDRDRAIQNALEEQFDAFRESLNGLSRSTFVDRLLELDGHGHTNQGRIYEEAALEWNLDDTIARELGRDYRSRYHRHCRLADDTLSTFQALRQSGRILGLITNGPVVWQEKTLNGLGLDGRFDVVLISEREGVRKPHRAIFARALELSGVRSDEAVFVGDHPDADVAGGRAAGLISIWKRVPYWEMTIEGVPIVDSLHEIVPIVLGGI